MTELDPETRALLADAKRAGPSPEIKARDRRRILAAAAAGSLSAVSTAANASLLSSLWGGAVSALAVGVGAGALVSVSALLLSENTSEVQPTLSRSGTASLGSGRPFVRTHAAPEPSIVPEASLPAKEATRADSRSGSRSATSVPSIDRETAALMRAQTALRQGDPALALALLADYDAEFPTGALAEEALAARVVALCSSGKLEDGQRSLNAFLRSYPGSPLVGRVRDACPDQKK